MQLTARGGTPISALITVETPWNFRILQAATLKGVDLQLARGMWAEEAVWSLQKDTFTEKMAPAVTLISAATVVAILASSRKYKRRFYTCSSWGHIHKVSQTRNSTSQRGANGLQVTVPTKTSSLRDSCSSINPKSKGPWIFSVTTSSPQFLYWLPQDELTKPISRTKLRRYLLSRNLIWRRMTPHLRAWLRKRCLTWSHREEVRA